MIPEKLGKYEIRGTLGRGAMGQVYDGWDPLIHRQVAIKTVRLADAGDEEAVEGLARFRREAQAAGRLSHPNIVGVFDFGETDEVAYIVMEFVSGGSLKDVLDRREPLPSAWVCRTMGQVLAGLAYSHARGVVHRDVKPANVMLDAEGAAKLADFGIARIESSGATSAGAIMGTPAYMAPEQFLGEPADSRSDIYAAGAMLFHLLTGTRPYEGNPSAIMHKVLNASAPPKASERRHDVTEAMDAVLQRAMARRQEDRFLDATAFAKALDAASCGQAEELEEERTVVIRKQAASPATSPLLAHAPPASRSVASRLRPLRVVVATAILLAGSTTAWLLLGPARRLASSSPPSNPPAPAAMEQARPQAILPQSPPPTLAERALALNREIAAMPCTLARAIVTGNVLAVSGAAGEGEAEERLRRQVSSAPGQEPIWQVRSVPASTCAALASVHAAASSSLVQLGLQLAHILRTKGEIHLYPSISGLDFPAFLRVDYLSGDGTLFHVYPHVRDQATNNVEDPSELLPAQSTLRLGTRDHQVLQMVPPFENDLILAVASDSALLPERRPNTEPADAYFAALRIAIGQAKARGQRLAAGAASLRDVSGDSDGKR